MAVTWGGSSCGTRHTIPKRTTLPQARVGCQQGDSGPRVWDADHWVGRPWLVCRAPKDIGLEAATAWLGQL